MNIEEFNIVVYPLKDKAYRFARRLMKDNAEAEDLTQDMFVRLWQMRDKLEVYRNIESLAMTTIKNLCLDRMKKKKPVLADVETDYESFLRTDNDRQMEFSDIAGKINTIVDELPESHRAAFHLKDIEGYDYDEIEKILEINRSTLKVNLSRARKKIREILQQRYSYEYR